MVKLYSLWQWCWLEMMTQRYWRILRQLFISMLLLFSFSFQFYQNSIVKTCATILKKILCMKSWMKFDKSTITNLEILILTIKTQIQLKVTQPETRIAYRRRHTQKWVYLCQKQGKRLLSKIKLQLKEQEFLWKVKWARNSNKHWIALKTYMETKVEENKVKSLTIQTVQA